MTTKLISLNEYRKNLSTIWKTSQKQNIRYIVLVHSKPVMEVKPIYNDTIDNNILENKIEDFTENEIELLEKEWNFKKLTNKFNDLSKKI